MQADVLEKQIISTIHGLSLDKLKSVLDFSLFIQSLSSNSYQEIAKPLKRQAGLGKSTVWMSEDFDEPLPDSFWLGEEK